jgi:hypothetical protein
MVLSLECFHRVMDTVLELDDGRPLPIRAARMIEFLKFPHAAVSDHSPLARLAASDEGKARNIPDDLWSFVAWVGETYPDIDLGGGPSFERLIRSGRE